MKPKAEEIAHVAPEPVASRVAAPVQPALKERGMAHPIANLFQPKSRDEDLADAPARPTRFKPRRKISFMPASAPSLQSKSFGGIRTKDLPFQMGTDQELAGGNATVIPVAVGNRSAKVALGYANPALQDAGRHQRRALSEVRRPGGDHQRPGRRAPSTIQLSGTGGAGNAPTGATHGAVIQDRAGSGSGGGLVSRPCSDLRAGGAPSPASAEAPQRRGGTGQAAGGGDRRPQPGPAAEEKF